MRPPPYNLEKVQILLRKARQKSPSTQFIFVRIHPSIFKICHLLSVPSSLKSAAAQITTTRPIFNSFAQTSSFPLFAIGSELKLCNKVPTILEAHTADIHILAFYLKIGKYWYTSQKRIEREQQTAHHRAKKSLEHHIVPFDKITYHCICIFRIQLPRNRIDSWLCRLHDFPGLKFLTSATLFFFCTVQV